MPTPASAPISPLILGPVLGALLSHPLVPGPLSGPVILGPIVVPGAVVPLVVVARIAGSERGMSIISIKDIWVLHHIIVLYARII